MSEKMYKLDSKEKQKAIKELLKNNTQRGLSRELGIPYSTIHDWISGRQDNKGENMHVSLQVIFRKINNLDPKKIEDWGRIEMIRDSCNKLLKEKQFGNGSKNKGE